VHSTPNHILGISVVSIILNQKIYFAFGYIIHSTYTIAYPL